VFSVRNLFFACVLVAAFAPARADGRHKRGAAPAPPPSREDQARELYKKGMTHYELGEFDTAIDEFKRAYALTSAPGLLFNLAQVYRMKKDPEQAVYFYRTYLRLVPNAPNRADVEALIAENQALLDEARAKKRAADEAAAAAAAAAAAPATPTRAVAPMSPAPPPRRRPWRAELISGAAVGALGVGALATAVALGARASSDASKISSANAQGDVPWDSAKQQLYRDGQSSATAATVLYVAGGVVAATGVVLVALGLHDRARARSFAVAPSPGGASLVMSCAF
jgi:tetratricopeptide (TPR) repeat protein